MPGLRGSNREPGVSARERRNANAMAIAFAARSLGDGLQLDSNRLLALALLATGGLEFSNGALKIKYPADGGLMTSAVGLEVNMVGMAARSPFEDTDLMLMEEAGLGNAKYKATVASLRTLFGWTYPADGALKNTGTVYEVDISGMAAQATPAEGDLFLLEDSGGTDAKEKVTLAELRDAIVEPVAGGGLKHAVNQFEVDIVGLPSYPAPSGADSLMVEKTGFGAAKQKIRIDDAKVLFAGGWTFPADGALKNTGAVYEVDISGMAAHAVPEETDVMLVEDVMTPDGKKKITIAQLRLALNNPNVDAIVTKTTGYTIALHDKVIFCDHATTPFDIELPANGASRAGALYHITNINVARVRVAPNTADGTQTINGVPEIFLEQDDSITVVTNGTLWRIL